MIKISRFKLTTMQILSIGFALVILLGGLLLTLPVASKSGTATPFINALFTSTSAACVTGLSVYDIYTHYSMFGQVVMVCLFEVGGLGFMMIAFLFSMAIHKKIGLRERSIMMESVGALRLGGIVRLVQKAVLGTLIIQLTGAAVLALRFCPKYGLATGVWFGIYHAVSAFCNAGFDLLGITAPSTSLTTVYNDVTINVVIMLLIIVGGIGFIVWEDIIQNKWHFRHYRLQTKIVLVTTAFLIVAGAAGFYIFESDVAFAGMNTGDKILASFFQSVTPRTAGFCTVDMTKLGDSGSILTIILMIIGASPGSTGGGIKTTTFFVIILSIAAYIRGEESVNIFNRKIEDEAVKRSYNGATLYLFAAIAGIIIIMQQGIGLGAAAFEAVSAIGTVGLSKNLTPSLNVASKITVIALMYIGRVGSMSIAMALSRRVKTKVNHVPEKITTL